MSSISGIASNLASTQSNGLAASLQQQQQQQGLFANLNLNATQQSQIQQILQNAQSQGQTTSQVLGSINNVLTPAQQAQLQTNLSDVKGQHHHHHHGGGGGGGTSSNNDTDEFGIPVSTSTTSNSGTIGNIASTFFIQSQLQNNNGNPNNDAQ